MTGIVYASSNEYAYLLGISLLSLLENNRNIADIEIYVLEESISDENKEKLKAIGRQYNRTINFVNVSEKVREIMKAGVTEHHSDKGVSYVTYARLYLDMLVPDSIERVLYLDCDTLVVGDIIPLLNVRIDEDKSIAMACDLCRMEYRKVIGLDLQQKYYSAGIMVIDIRNWKAHKCRERIFEHIEQTGGKYPLVDQDLINVVLGGGEIATIGAQYNFLSQYFLYSYENCLKVYHLNSSNYYNRADYEQARENPVIYHFSGGTLCRPWYCNSRHPLKECYNSYYYKSPWRDNAQLKCNKELPYRVQAFLYRNASPGIATFCGRIMQWSFMKIIYKV